MPVSRRELLSRLLECQSYDAAASLVFEHFELLDELFFAELLELEPWHQNIIYEAVLRAIGVAEDPEIVGPNERHVITLFCGNLRPPPDGDEAGMPNDHVRRWLRLATDDDLAEPPATAMRLAIVYHAMGLIDGPGSGSDSGVTPTFLRALGDITRARVLAQETYRTFDAVQYLRRGIKVLEAQLDGADPDEAAAIESTLMTATVLLIDLTERLARESKRVGDAVRIAGGEEP